MYTFVHLLAQNDSMALQCRVKPYWAGFWIARCVAVNQTENRMIQKFRINGILAISTRFSICFDK